MEGFPWSIPEQWEHFLQSHCHLINSPANNYGLTVLHLAVQRGHLSLVKLLVSAGIDLETRTPSGESAFLLACQGGSLYITHALVAAGADVMATNNKGCSCIHLAASGGNVHIIQYLVKTKGLSLAGKDNDFNTALHYAVRERRTETVKYILKHEADSLSSANAKGQTPLHLAVLTRNIGLCWKLVLASNANLLDMKDGEGRTPVDLAMHHSYSGLARQLKTWNGSRRTMLFKATMCYLLHAVGPGVAFFLGMCCYAKLSSPTGIILTVLLLIGGFIYPIIYFHRIAHPARWPCPSMHGAFVFGISVTMTFYFAQVLPRVWPSDKLLSVWIVSGSILMIYMLYLLRTSDPGVNEHSRRSIDGRTLTIVDVASGEESIHICLHCELIVPDYTKHCFMCEHCVSGFDHHCQWLMKCIGYKNHCLFVTFLYVVGMENCLFIIATLSCIIQVHSVYHPIDIIKTTATDEPWLFILIPANLFTGFIACANLLFQLKYISLLGTTYFDKHGNKAYKKDRSSREISLLERLRNVLSFFTDYNKWKLNKTKHKTVSTNFSNL